MTEPIDARSERTLWTFPVSTDEVRSSPEHEEPHKAVDWSYVDQFERGMLGGGFVWPYTDV